MAVRDIPQQLHAYFRTITGETRPVEIAGYSADYYLHQYWQKSFHDQFFADERPVLSKVLASLSDEDIFYDVGGHFGQYACLASAVVPAEHLYSFEPDGFNRAILRRNLALNDCDATVVRTALTNRNGLGPTPNIAGDDFVRQGHRPPTIIKMDIEGGELAALKGFREVLSDNCREIYCELHPVDQTDVPAALSAAEVKEVYTVLERAGFSIERTDVRGQPFIIGSKR